jgi:hypothetical protein
MLILSVPRNDTMTALRAHNYILDILAEERAP